MPQVHRLIRIENRYRHGCFAAATYLLVRLAMPLSLRNCVKPWSLLAASLLISGVSFVVIPFTDSVGLLMAIMFFAGPGAGCAATDGIDAVASGRASGRERAEALGLELR
jgi:hypothetical protein